MLAESEPDWNDVFPRSHENLEKAIVQNWENCRGNSEYFKNLYESMPRRLHEVIVNGGGPTNY